MNSLTESLAFIEAKNHHLFSVECGNCNSTFLRNKRQIKLGFEKNKTKKIFCRKCLGTQSYNYVFVRCGTCSTLTRKNLSERTYSLSGLNFCSRSCSVTYQNNHKTKGTRRSKMEIWIESQISIIFPNLVVHYCETQTIGKELDIYIPTLKIAFELNGIFHYKPIYGEEKFIKTIENDKIKFQKCKEFGLNLYVFDTSKVTNCKPPQFQLYLDKIVDIINAAIV